MSKSLEELAREYDSACAVLTQRIGERNRLLRRLSPTGDEAHRLKCELAVLYRERSDAMATAKHLASYYMN